MLTPYPAASNGAALQPAHTGGGVNPLILGNKLSFWKSTGVDKNSRCETLCLWQFSDKPPTYKITLIKYTLSAVQPSG
jgi:hypothetical protein